MSHPFAPFMREAIALAERGRWKTATNPTVGAVLVRDGVVLARGWHTAFGRGHAEVECLADARARGIDPASCTLVVTLEPCNHYGKTPPCSEAVLAAGIKHVVIGLQDPNPQHSGGAKRLADAGVRVEMGVCEAECRELIADFLIWQTTDRPYVIVKLAMTMDGRIATRTGHSKWISCPASLKEVHVMRANIGRAGGVVLVGGNTLHQDNPLLNARDVPVEKQPLAAAITSRVPSPDTLALLQRRPSDTILFTTASGAATPRAAQLRTLGVRVVGLDRWKAGGEDLKQALTHLRTEENCPYVFCEGGGKLALSLLEAGLVDELHLYIAPKLLGDNEARPLFDGRSPLSMDDALCMRLAGMQQCGDDAHLVFKAVH